ncbi:hypothetical protein CAPTEDRAFT_81384, partial [Capitella teleta]
VAQRITYKLCVLVYKAIHEQAPEYIKGMISQQSPTRTLRSQAAVLLEVPR